LEWLTRDRHSLGSNLESWSAKEPSKRSEQAAGESRGFIG
jgi:hypothetical protein